jgi:ubiquinone/menaquinone biosynthesis C-methylase UbiE
LLPLYDPAARFLFGEDAIKRRVLELADIRSGQRVLDVGCGTGTLALRVKEAQPDAQVVGLDGDPKALAIARRKAARAGLDVAFDEGFSYSLPYPDGSFERVLSSFVFHHLAGADKQRSLAEILRVLVPGGVFILLDFGRPVSFWERIIARGLSRSEPTRDNLEGRLVSRMRDAGFSEVEEIERRGTLFGSAWYHRASKGSAAAP